MRVVGTAMVEVTGYWIPEVTIVWTDSPANTVRPWAKITG